MIMFQDKNLVTPHVQKLKQLEKCAYVDFRFGFRLLTHFLENDTCASSRSDN